jgi:hypothetical protein
MKVTLEIEGKTYDRELDDNLKPLEIAGVVKRTVEEIRDGKVVPPVDLDMTVGELWSSWGEIIDGFERGADCWGHEDRARVRGFVERFETAFKKAIG